MEDAIGIIEGLERLKQICKSINCERSDYYDKRR
mgnify:CR=1 FL=1